MALKENKKLIENFGAYLHCLKKKKKKLDSVLERRPMVFSLWLSYFSHSQVLMLSETQRLRHQLQNKPGGQFGCRSVSL